MEYEETFEQQPFNYRLLVLLCLCSVFFGIMIYPVIKPQEIKTVTIEQNKSDVIQIVYRDVFVTPTPDGKIYFVSEYETGIRKINRPFSFVREKTLGLKDTVIHAQVYDYKIFNSYNWFNPTDYKYYRQKPQSGNDKFLFVFFNIYLDDIQGDDTRFWIPKEEQMNILIRDKTIAPLVYPKQLRIKELEESFNLNDDSRIEAFNSKRMYNPSSLYASTAGETIETQDVLKGGKSNAIDGYIIFEIPKDINDNEILFNCNFYAWGIASWRLKPD